MAYPVEILPNPSYKDLDCNLSDFYLIRSFSLQEDEPIQNEYNQINQKYICDPTANISDLSTSLLSIFKTEYSKIRLTDIGKQQYVDYCLSDAIVPVPGIEHFFIDENSNFWVLLISDIYDLPLYFDLSSEPLAICKVLHTPMKWNYWHFSVRLLTPEGWINPEDRKALKRGPIRRICHQARASICELAILSPNEIKNMSEDCYFK